jgi:hypothetical protein
MERRKWEGAMWQDWGEEGEAEKKRKRRIKEKIKNKHSRVDGEVV